MALPRAEHAPPGAASTADLRARLLRAVDDVGPVAEADREEGDRLGRLTDRVVAALAAGGLLMMKLPAEVGGEDADPLTQFAVLERLAGADGAAAWNAMAIGTAGAFTASHLPDAGVAEATGGGSWPVLAGTFPPTGRARPVPGGWVVHGRLGLRQRDPARHLGGLRERGRGRSGGGAGAGLVRAPPRPGGRRGHVGRRRPPGHREHPLPDRRRVRPRDQGVPDRRRPTPPGRPHARPPGAGLPPGRSQRGGPGRGPTGARRGRRRGGRPGAPGQHLVDGGAGRRPARAGPPGPRAALGPGPAARRAPAPCGRGRRPDRRPPTPRWSGPGRRPPTSGGSSSRSPCSRTGRAGPGRSSPPARARRAVADALTLTQHVYFDDEVLDQWGRAMLGPER